MSENDRGEDAVRIANSATYWPIAPMDVVVAAPIAVRLLFGASPLGAAIQGAALAAYLGSAAQDWYARIGVRKIDFRREFGADVHNMEPMPSSVREAEVQLLVERVNDEFTPRRIPRRELAVEVDRHLTGYIASVTGQRVETSTEVRDFALARLVFPFALGACDLLSSDVAIFRDVGVFEPHVIAHEFSHRKGYWRELEAQALAYLALTASGEDVLVQSALCERLHRQRVTESRLRPELRGQLLELAPEAQASSMDRQLEVLMRRLYDERMRLTGQNGLSDYDVGFTNFLYTFEVSPGTRQSPPPAGALRTRRPG
jgi:hypothetical protein